MLLDNLFAMVGGFTTSAMLLVVVALVAWPPLSALFCPRSLLLLRGGRR